MIGNDVVDRVFAKNRYNVLHPRWMEKVLLPAEKEQITQFDDLELALWAFWSLKESAYKVFFKKTFKRGFIPKKFECRLLHIEKNQINAQIQSPLGSWFGKIEISNAYLHAMVTSQKMLLNTIKHKLIPFKETTYFAQSHQVHQHLKEALSQLCLLPCHQLEILKEQSVPKVFFKNKVLPIDVSLSHHHQWGAFAYL